MILTSRYDSAFLYAHQLHRDQTRKGTDIPYISHLVAVSAMVIEHGGNEDQAIAALLHDAIEDQAANQGGAENLLAEIRRRFGDTVAKIVEDCTDAWTDFGMRACRVPNPSVCPTSPIIDLSPRWVARFVTWPIFAPSAV